MRKTIGHGYYKTHNKFVPTLTGRLTASRQVSLYFLCNEQYQAQDRYDTRAEHDPLKPSAFSRHLLYHLVRHGYRVRLGAIERVMHFTLDILRVPTFYADGVASLRHMDGVMQPN